MPTFDFRCTACDCTFEYSRPFGSNDHPSCPECASEETEKRIAPPAVHFKGSGFYKTDSTITPPKKTEEPKPQKTEETKAKSEDKPTGSTPEKGSKKS